MEFDFWGFKITIALNIKLHGPEKIQLSSWETNDSQDLWNKNLVIADYDCVKFCQSCCDTSKGYGWKRWDLQVRSFEGPTFMQTKKKDCVLLAKTKRKWPELHFPISESCRSLGSKDWNFKSIGILYSKVFCSWNLKIKPRFIRASNDIWTRKLDSWSRHSNNLKSLEQGIYEGTLHVHTENEEMFVRKFVTDGRPWLL